MRIVFTGGGTGGHFYPIIAVVQSLVKEVSNQKLLDPDLYYFGPDPYDKSALFDYGIQYRYVAAGKLKRSFSFTTVSNIFMIALGVLQALLLLYRIYPDVVFSKGGYASVPVVFAARLLRIPIVIHESDSIPGAANRWASKFAQRIAISYPEASQYFDKEKVALTGNPIRQELFFPAREGAREYLKMDEDVPVVLVLGGSQGAQAINDVVVDALPKLVDDMYVVHQAGEANVSEIKRVARVALENNSFSHRYKLFGFLDLLAMRMAAGAADIVVTRAGSTLFEIAAWGVPAIIVPIPEDVSHDQRSNAYSYARAGGGVVIEQHNLTDDILISEIKSILQDATRRQHMIESAKRLVSVDAAQTIAKGLLEIGLSHEQ